MNYIKKIKNELKNNKLKYFVYFSLRGLIILCLIVQLIRGDFDNVSICLLSLVLLFLPFIIEHHLKIDMPNVMEIIIMVFVFSAEILGEINNKVIYQTLPEGRDKGTCALSKKQQEAQHNVVKNAVMNKNNRGGTSFFTVSAGTKLSSLEVGNTDIFDEKYESNIGDKIALDLGFAASALNGVGSGSYSSQEQNLELVTAQLFQWIEQIDSEINKCISENIIKDNQNWVECRYLPITYVNKSKMVNYAKDLYLQGKGSLSLWASACGIYPDIFFALLDQELSDDIENKYPVHKTSYTISSKDNEGGRPTTDNPTDRTLQSRANGGNNIPSPSDNK